MLAPNTVLRNRYQIVRQLGQGGMGAVYLATDQTFGSTVALKETLISDELLRKAFEREARLLNSLRHAALPHVFDYFFEASGQFLVMQFIPGDDLGQQLKRSQRPFPPDDVLKWTDQLLDLLDYLHTHEPPIVHRDIKPENLKLTPRGDIILLDFGLAKGAVDQMTQASSKSLFGYTPHYAPFEQIRGTGTDPRSDLYSLAATVFHLLSGRLPPDALSRAESVLNGEPDPLANLSPLLPMVPPPVAGVLQRALAQKRDHRFQTASEMRAALRDATRAMPPTAKIAPPVGYSPTVVESAPPSGSGGQRPPSYPPQYPSTPPTHPVHPSGPQGQGMPSYPPQTLQGPYPPPPVTPSAAPRSRAPMWIGLAVIALVFVAIAAVAAVLVVPKLLNPDQSVANSNAPVSNANGNTAKGPRTVPESIALEQQAVANAPTNVLEVTVSDDGKLVASSGDEGPVRLWSGANGESGRVLLGLEQPSRGLDFSPDGTLVTAGADDGTVRTWKVADGSVVRSTKGHDAFVFIVQYSPDGKWFATAGGDKAVKIWSVADGTTHAVITAPDSSDQIINVSPDLRYVAFYKADKGVTVWSIADDKKVSALGEHRFDLKSGAFSPDGTQLALGSTDGKVRIWNTSDGSLARELETPGGYVTRIRWLGDGAMFVAGSADGTLRAFRAADGKKLFESRSHRGSVACIRASADGTRVVTGGADKTIHIWKVVAAAP